MVTVGHAEAQAGHDLSLEAGPDAQGDNAHPRRGEEVGEVRHVTDDHDVLTRQRGDGRRDGVAGDDETVVDTRVADEPEDLLDEPVHRVHVGQVDEAAQEDDVAPCAGTRARAR